MTVLLRTVNIDITSMLSKEQIGSIIDTAKEYAKAFDYSATLSCALQSTNANVIHKNGYQNLKQLCPTLPTAIIQAAMNNSCAAVLSYNSNVPNYNRIIKSQNEQVKKYLVKRNRGYEYNPKSLKETWQYNGKHKGESYKLNTRALTQLGDKISFGTVNKRISINCKLPKWFDSKYPNKRLYSGSISIEHGHNVTLHLTYALLDESKSTDLNFKYVKPTSIEDVDINTVIGIDRGIYHPIATSNGILISSKPYYAVQRKYAYNEEKLKQKSTSSSRRRLRSMAGKRHCYTNDVNHCISKQIANIPNITCIVFEDLTNMRIKHRDSKKLRMWINSWSFRDLEFKTTYKCQNKGIAVKFVNPKNTSKRCSNCHEYPEGARIGNRFVCPICGHAEHSDLNAAKNIRDRYLDNLSNYLGVHSTTHDASAEN